MKRKREWNERRKRAWEEPDHHRRVYAEVVTKVIGIVANRVAKEHGLDPGILTWRTMKSIDCMEIDRAWRWSDIWALVKTQAILSPERFGEETSARELIEARTRETVSNLGSYIDRVYVGRGRRS